MILRNKHLHVLKNECCQFFVQCCVYYRLQSEPQDRRFDSAKVLIGNCCILWTIVYVLYILEVMKLIFLYLPYLICNSKTMNSRVYRRYEAASFSSIATFINVKNQVTIKIQLCFPFSQILLRASYEVLRICFSHFNLSSLNAE